MPFQTTTVTRASGEVAPGLPASWSEAAASHPLNIAVVAACPFPAPRGTPIRILRLAEEMAARGHRIHVVTYHLGSAATVEGMTVHRIGTLRTDRELPPGPTVAKLALYDPRLFVALARLLRHERIDIIHAHHYEGLLVGSAARFGTDIPLVFDAHTLLSSELPLYHLGLPRRCVRTLGSLGDRRFPRLADHVVSCSERIQTWLVESGTVRAEEVTLVPNGVEPELFAPDRHLPAVAEGTPPGRAAEHPTLVFTGNLSAYQGIDLMLDAFQRVRARRPDARLRIVTSDPFEPYEELARTLGVRAALDLQPASFATLPGDLAVADVALNPRMDCAGIPVKLLNYLAAERPVVSFAGSAPGLVHRRTGWLAQDGDVAGFAEGILALLDDPALAAELGQNARRFVQANHSWARSADILDDVFAAIVARQPSRR